MVTTAEPASTQQAICKGAEGTPAKFRWDMVAGLQAVNSTAQGVIATMGEAVVKTTRNNPVATLVLCGQHLPDDGMLIMHNAQRYMDEAPVMQAIWNTRDEFKANGRLLLLFATTGTKLPAELRHDVIHFDEPLPDQQQLEEIVGTILDDLEDVSGQKHNAAREQARDAAIRLRGTNSFAAENLAAMSLNRDGFRTDYLDRQARKVIEQTPGLSFEEGTQDFSAIGGLDAIKEWGELLFNGPAAPAVVIRVEELEKSMAGTAGDTSGTSQDSLQVLLSSMEDYGWNGILAYGAPGSGKSLYAKCLANQFGAKALRFDINACKGSLVGQSEQRIREAMKVIRTLGGARVFFIASCNKLQAIPAELQRRFRSGVWYWDTPDAEQREDIWDIQLRSFGQELDRSQIREIDEDDYTGADIRDIVEQSWQLGCSIEQAKKYTIPLKKRSPEILRECRELADGKFLCTKHGNEFKMQQTPKTNRRRKLADV
jgi:hypothetical protein